MTKLPITSEFITLAQALKIAGLAATGGHAKVLVRDEEITVNGKIATQPGRKLFPLDRFRFGNQEWQIVTGESEVS